MFTKSIIRSFQSKWCAVAVALLLAPNVARAATPSGSNASFGFGFVSDLGGSDLRRKSFTRTLDLGNQHISISGLRQRSAPRPGGLISGTDAAIRSWSLSGQYGHDIGSFGSFGVFGSAAIDRRHPGGLFTTSRTIGSRTLFAGLEWAGTSNGHLAVGLFKSDSAGGHSGYNRIAELAAGAAPKASGLRLAGELMSSKPGDGSRRFTTIGFDARLQKLEMQDGGSIGSRASGTDRRLAMMVRKRF